MLETLFPIVNIPILTFLIVSVIGAWIQRFNKDPRSAVIALTITIALTIFIVGYSPLKSYAAEYQHFHWLITLLGLILSWFHWREIGKDE